MKKGCINMDEYLEYLFVTGQLDDNKDDDDDNEEDE